MNNYDSLYYRKYTYKSELDKAIHTLEGILKGIAIDEIINSKEIDELNEWLFTYREHQRKHPFNEIIPVLINVLDDNILDSEEYDDLLWIFNNIKTDNKYFDLITTDIQKLHGILHGIMADNIITKDELRGLQEWLDSNKHLAGIYPYDEINSVVTSVLADGILTDEEKNFLKLFFAEFIDINVSKNINPLEILQLKQEININGICVFCPEIIIPQKAFCFTGMSSRTTRSTIKDTLESLGGIFNNSVNKQTDYLVVGNNGNPCWAFACYGRKVEKAVKLRKSGHGILIVHENDFWDSFEDFDAGIS